MRLARVARPGPFSARLSAAISRSALAPMHHTARPHLALSSLLLFVARCTVGPQAGEYRAGTCKGIANGFRCKPLLDCDWATQYIVVGDDGVGTCSGTRPACDWATQYIEGSSPTAPGTCAADIECHGDDGHYIMKEWDFGATQVKMGCSSFLESRLYPTLAAAKTECLRHSGCVGVSTHYAKQSNGDTELKEQHQLCAGLATSTDSSTSAKLNVAIAKGSCATCKQPSCSVRPRSCITACADAN